MGRLLMSFDLILSEPRSGVSKDGNQSRCCPPFETHRCAMLLRVRCISLIQHKR